MDVIDKGIVINIIFNSLVMLQFRPLEQLMGVFPAASSSHVPAPWANLMSDPVSVTNVYVRRNIPCPTFHC
jgi:5'-3' exonuclease